MKHKPEPQEQKPLSVAQRLLHKQKFTYNFAREKDIKTAEGRRLHKIGAEIIKEETDAR